MRFDWLSPLVDELTKPRDEWPDEDDWACRLYSCLPPCSDDKKSVAPSLTALAESYFNHLGLALWNLHGKSTPDESIHPTPNCGLIDTVTVLLREVKQGRTSALKRLVEIRDIPTCPVTKQPFREKAKPTLGIWAQTGVTSELAHIIPLSLQSKTQAHVAIETFTGATITAADVVNFINAPANALLLQYDAHQEYDKQFAWGIEAACFPDGTVRYYTRAVRPDELCPLTRPGMDKEMMFGTRSTNWADAEQWPNVESPNPHFCNMMLAVMRVLHASGAAEVLDQIRMIDEQSREDGSNMGSSPSLDDLLMTKLTLLEMSRSDGMCPKA